MFWSILNSTFSFFSPWRCWWTRCQSPEPGRPERSARRRPHGGHQRCQIHLPQRRGEGSHERVCWTHSPAEKKGKVTNGTGSHWQKQLLVAAWFDSMETFLSTYKNKNHCKYRNKQCTCAWTVWDVYPILGFKWFTVYNRIWEKKKTWGTYLG